MKYQKGFAKITTLVLVVLFVGLIGYFASARKSTEIVYSGQWTQAQFPQNDYRHSVNIMLPTDWKFNCCGDTDGFSAHAVYPASSENNLETGPLITVYDFGLRGCPNNASSCSIDQLQQISPNQYMTNLIERLDGTGEAIGLRSLRKTGIIKLNNFSSDAVIYSGISRSNQKVDLYIVQSPKGVIGVVFQQPQNFDSKLKTEFLNKITINQ